MGLETAIQWIKTLYNIPLASVITNGIISPFQLQRGTRQGCPLSPLLFALFLEPLAAAIRQNDKITGVLSINTNHKISLYADDILLFLQNPKTSLTEIIKLINEYSIISDYSINWTKSTILPLNRSIQDTPFKINNITRWMNLPLSIIGRIATVKMCILPKLLYLFTMTPVQPTKKWFT